MKQDEKRPEFAGPNEKANLGEDRKYLSPDAKLSGAGDSWKTDPHSDTARLDKLERIHANIARNLLGATAPGFLVITREGIGLITTFSVANTAKPTLREAIDDAEELG